MRPSTENLLSIRDGEPVAVEALVAVESLPAAQRELERLRQLQDALRSLPELKPPLDGWQRVLVLERERRLAPHRWLKALTATGAVAAAAAVLAVLVATAPPQGAGTIASTRQPMLDEPDRREVAAAVAESPHEYLALVAESARLEQVLAAVPSPRPRMTVSMASTIVGIEDRIAFIDEQLTFGNARGVQWPQREALWSERVDLMSALVQVRLAQSR